MIDYLKLLIKVPQCLKRFVKLIMYFVKGFKGFLI